MTLAKTSIPGPIGLAIDRPCFHHPRGRTVIATGWTIALIGGVLASAMVGYLVRRRRWEKRREDEIKLFRAKLEQRQKAEEQRQWREKKRRRLFRGLKLDR